MNPLAAELNAILKGSAAGALLSELGLRMFFPKGIVAQSAEAKKQATRANATIGIATKGGSPVFLDAIRSLVPGLTPDEIFPYAPTQGIEKLRELWKKEIVHKNPDIGSAEFSLPVVVPGLTAGVSTLADMFVNPGDTLVLPDLHWDNYPLIFETRRDARITLFPFYSSAGGFNVEGLTAAMKGAAGAGKIVLLLNFPNNPTGYSPSRAEADAVVKAVREVAAAGTRLLVITDDAYFGLFYEEQIYRQSLFALFCSLHENVLAAKVDGSTKEDLTWGFRTGFITFGGRGLTKDQYDALVRKLMGALRSTISNSSILAQNLIIHAIENPSRQREKDEAARLLRSRYECVKQIVAAKMSTAIQALPFNSGYFMSFRLNRGKAEDLRKKLLAESGVGTIAIDERCLRVAFSSVDLEKLPELYDLIYATAEKL
ncbi:MAG: aminotransferase class I/II-fold pyridoxal phosphate-dependent enzyme [Spirochaetia bacterium]|jgi:aspartate/methionine/tyrosine aminotransferase